MIEVINFTKRYGDFVAVDNLSFAIGKGEIFGFIGPNGAGKSTTIRFLATLLRPTAGEGRVAGFSVTTEPMAVRRVIGFMPDDFGVYDGMKVWEFLDFFAVAYEIPRSYRKKIIGEVLDLLDLTHKRDDYVNGLSKGMKQRLCLAKTLVHDPPVLILDEPASGLDPRARLEMKALLNELKQMGKTILISSHILSELADFCTSIGIIERGKMLAAGNIQEIQARIRSHRVLKVRVLDETTDRAAEHPSRRFIDPHGGDLRSHPDRRVRGRRPGHGPAARTADPGRGRGAIVCRGAALARGSIHDDHQGNRQLGRGSERTCGRARLLPSRHWPGGSAGASPSRDHRRILRLSGASKPGMLFRDNPVLTRELLVTLRSPRSFVLQLLYVCALGALVYFYWPAGEEGARAGEPGRRPGAFRHLLPRAVLSGGPDGADLRRGEHHGREGTEDLRAALGQPAAAVDDLWSASS